MLQIQHCICQKKNNEKQAMIHKTLQYSTNLDYVHCIYMDLYLSHRSHCKTTRSR